MRRGSGARGGVSWPWPPSKPRLIGYVKREIPGNRGARRVTQRQVWVCRQPVVGPSAQTRGCPGGRRGSSQSSRADEQSSLAHPGDAGDALGCPVAGPGSRRFHKPNVRAVRNIGQVQRRRAGYAIDRRETNFDIVEMRFAGRVGVESGEGKHGSVAMRSGCIIQLTFRINFSC